MNKFTVIIISLSLLSLSFDINETNAIIHRSEFFVNWKWKRKTFSTFQFWFCFRIKVFRKKIDQISSSSLSTENSVEKKVVEKLFGFLNDEGVFYARKRKENDFGMFYTYDNSTLFCCWQLAIQLRRHYIYPPDDENQVLAFFLPSNRLLA